MSERSPGLASRWLRLRALAVALPAFLVIGGVAYLLLDGAVERAVEDTGSDIVGARVDLAAADFRVTEGRIVLEDLQVANPDAPFTNLLEAAEIVVDIAIEPLLEKKLVADTVVVRGIRFGTPRETSGALDSPSPESGRLWREVNAWAESLQLPSFTLEGLGGVVNVDAIDEDSLTTLGLGESLIEDADSMRAHWEDVIRDLDPRPVLDSAQALIERLGEAQRTPPNLIEATRLVRSGQALVTRLQQLRTDVRAADSAAATDVRRLAGVESAFRSALDADLAYGRRLLRLPSLTAPNLSPVIFHETAISWLRPVLYWVNTAEEYLPPGLDPARRPGPSRARSAGTTVTFPGQATYPRFLLRYGALDMEIGGTGLGSGRYDGSIRGLSSAPALSGGPIEVEARRTDAPRGPEGITLRAVLDHAARPLRDSVRLSLTGVGLPVVELEQLGARLVPGQGSASFELSRTGGEIQAAFHWVSDDVRWEGGPATGTELPAIGTAAWTRSFLWRTLSGVGRLELEMGLRGSLSNPELHIESNLGDALARSLRNEVGAEVARAEDRLRAEVNRRVQPRIAEARARLDQLEAEVARIGPLAEEIREVRALLEERIAALLPGMSMRIEGVGVHGASGAQERG